MGSGPSVPLRPPVPAGLTRICVAGFGTSHNVGRAQKLAAAVAEAHADKYETWFYFSNLGYGKFLKTVLEELPADQKAKQSTLDKGTTVGQHHSAPFVWFEQGGQVGSGDEVE